MTKQLKQDTDAEHTLGSSGSEMSDHQEQVRGARVGCHLTCVQCGRTSTPQWREGPQGPKTLCNACGVKFSRSLKKQGLHSKQAAALKGTSPDAEHPGESVPRKPRSKRPSSLLRDDFVFNFPASEDPVAGPAGDDDERKAAQELLHFASLAAGSASEDGDGVAAEDGGAVDDLTQQPGSARRSNRKRQRSSRLAEPKDVIRPCVAPLASLPMGLAIMRPTVTAARFLAGRPPEDMLMHPAMQLATAGALQQQHRLAPATEAALAQAVPSQGSADGMDQSSDCDELGTAGLGEIISQLPIDLLSPSERQHLLQLQQAVAVAHAHAERTEAERKETFKHLMQKQAEAHQARVRLQQEARQLEREVQTARNYLTAAASAGIVSLLMGNRVMAHQPAPAPGPGAGQALPNTTRI